MQFTCVEIAFPHGVQLAVPTPTRNFEESRFFAAEHGLCAAPRPFRSVVVVDRGSVFANV